MALCQDDAEREVSLYGAIVGDRSDSD